MQQASRPSDDNMPPDSRSAAWRLLARGTLKMPVFIERGRPATISATLAPHSAEMMIFDDAAERRRRPKVLLPFRQSTQERAFSVPFHAATSQRK